MSEVKHSDLPWRIDCSESSSNYGATIITSSKVKAKKVAARLGGPDRDANAAFIVKACNAHDKLVAALQAYEQWEAEIIMEGKCWEGPTPMQLTRDLYNRMIEIQDMRNAALASLKED